MTEVAAGQETMQSLRAQLAEYEQIFRIAAPRLAAFKRLEEVAREQKTTPAAIAAQAAIVMLTNESRSKEVELRQFEAECRNLKGDIAMLLDNKTQITHDLDGLRIEYGDVQAEVVEILNELELLRNDAVRMMAERRELERVVQELRSQVGALRRRADDVTISDEAVSSNEEAEVSAPLPKRTASGFELEDDDENRRFDRFFHADVEHDKARDWILG